MIIWLASYPRSGNTLLRLLLKRVWGIGAYSIYNEGDDVADSGIVTRIANHVGHLPLGSSFAECYQRMRDSEQVYHIKTHEIPIDSHRAIYVVRDGRSASRSFCHYRRDFNGITDEASSLRDILLGFTAFGSWSNHLDTWNPLTRPGTLVVKYEELIEKPEGPIARIAEFLGAEPRYAWRNNFDELASIEPRLFRAAAANRPADALKGPELELFWMLHSPWMRRLGYLAAGDAPQVSEVSDEFRSRLYHAVAGQAGQLAAAESRANRLSAEHRQLSHDVVAAREHADALERRLADVKDENLHLQQRLRSIVNSRVLRCAWALHLSRRPEWFSQIEA